MLAYEFGEWLNDNTLGVFNDTGTTGNIFLGFMPDAPDAAIAIYSPGGWPADMDTGIHRPSLHLEVRDVSPVDAYNSAKAIMVAVHASQANFTAGGVEVLLVACAQSDPIDLGQDENGRFRYAINLEIITEE